MYNIVRVRCINISDVVRLRGAYTYLTIMRNAKHPEKGVYLPSWILGTHVNISFCFSTLLPVIVRL